MSSSSSSSSKMNDSSYNNNGSNKNKRLFVHSEQEMLKICVVWWVGKMFRRRDEIDAIGFHLS